MCHMQGGTILFKDHGGVTILDGRVDSSGDIRGEVIQRGIRDGTFTLKPQKATTRPR